MIPTTATKATPYHQMLVSRELGGAGLIALHVARHLQDAGRTSHVWIPGTGPAWDAATKLSLSCQTYDAAPALGGGKVAAAAANWNLGRWVRRRGGGIVHVHSPYQYGAFHWGLRLAGVARVAHVHLDEDADGLRWAFRRPPEMVVTCARFLADVVQRALPPDAIGRTRIIAVPNAVDTERFSPVPRGEAKARLGVPAGRPLVLMLANLAPHKGQETTIRAVGLLKRRGVDVTCWLAGVERDPGGYTDRLRHVIGQADVQDRVRLLGHRADAPDLLRAADFLLLPSTREGLPLSLLEAQATRVAVLAAPTAGIPEVVRDGETGFLIAADDADGYARRIEQLLCQPDLYGRVVQSAFVRASRNHNWSAYCGRLVELYDELLDARLGHDGRPVQLTSAHVLR